MAEQKFEQEVLGASTPVLVHFGAPWCGPCRMVEPLLSRFQSEWGKRFKLVGINADENLKLSSHYRITTLPTILLFEKGRVIHRLEGLYKRDELWQELQKVLVSSSPSTVPAEVRQQVETLR
ncbi:MAG: thioredoxin domain-containing protein [Kovacikia sp.]